MPVQSKGGAQPGMGRLGGVGVEAFLFFARHGGSKAEAVAGGQSEEWFRLKKQRVIPSGAQVERRAKRSRGTSAVRRRAALERTTGIPRLRSVPPAPARNSARDDALLNFSER